MGFQKVFWEIKNKTKQIFKKKGQQFFLVPACRFSGYKPLPEKSNVKHCFFFDKHIILTIVFAPSFEKQGHTNIFLNIKRTQVY